MKRGVLTVLSGFSGSGKGTIIKKLLSVHPETYALSVSATTRQKRMNEKTGVFEQDGVDYFFLTKEEFEKRIAEDRFIEYATYNENYYGTPKDYVFECLDKGLDVILEIEVQGALQIKEKFPDEIFADIVRYNSKIAEAPTFGKDIFEYASGSIGAVAYRNIATEIRRREEK